ncbi:MAG: DUF4932 domain-containing protein [Chloroflexi bacterium]|nr:DUF4932 domain-containing protein [Chloroflexota bacterium]
MSDQQDVTVRLDDRIRLMSAVLALTDWPARSQAEQPHGTHAHSRLTRKVLEPYREHPAVQGLQSLLNLGAPFEAVYTFALQLSWPDLTIEKLPVWVPPRWNDHLRDFYQKTNLAQFWHDEDGAWRASVFEAQKMFKPVAFKPFLQPFLGDVVESLVFMPNISFPTDREVGIRLDSELVCIAPPRLAWGDSPPWPFDEDPAHIYRAALTQYGRLLILSFLRENAAALASVAEAPLPVSDQFRAQYPTWQEQFTNLFVSAAVAMFLEQHVSKAEAKAYLLMERKTKGMHVLPGMMSVLQRYLKERANGRYHTLLDFMPIFPKQLRIANRIVTL